MKILNVLFICILLSSCTNVADKTCTCVREATNNAVFEGNQLSEDDLVALCIESQDKLKQLPLEEKDKIVKCIDSALNLISVKEMFPEKEKRELLYIKGGKEILGIIDQFNNRYHSNQITMEKAYYYFSKRPIAGRFAVEKVHRNMDDEIIFTDGTIELTGLLVEDGKVNSHMQVRLTMPDSTLGKIDESYYWDTTYQFIDFTGTCTGFGITMVNDFSIMIDASKYKIINNPDKALETKAPKDTASSLPVSETEQTNNENTTGTIFAVRAYFYREADLNTKRKGYLIKDQQVTTGKRKGDFIYCTYETDKGKTEGWMLISEIKN